MKLGELIAQHRAENDISQREFARRCGLSNSLISLMEMGKNPQTGKEMSPDLETYRKLANGMQISLQKLFEDLGDDATVNLSGDPNNSLEVGAAWYAARLPNDDIYLSKEEKEIIKAYRDSLPGIKFAVKKILDLV